MLERGACVISIDTELAWGEAHRRDGAGSGHHFEREREVVGRLLDLFARYDVAATWAMVGHLFLDRCERGSDGRPHPELLRPDYPWLDGRDWLDVDPCSSLDEAPYYYGRDLVEMVAACPADQEIASHAFSHVMAGDAGCSAEVFASELAASKAVAAAQDVELRSFVYPRNSVAYLDTLVEAGWTSYRGFRERPFPHVSGWRRRAVTAVDRVRPLAGSAVHPVPGPSGLWNLPQTYLFAPATSRRRLPVALWSLQPIARLRQAVRERSLFHLWFHPYNVTAAPDRSLAALERICRAAAKTRDQGNLDVLTMAQLTDRLNAAR